ncbi:ComEA family DNA-binding protein [Humibacillus xanthopallidus]|uniref:ComEA family DNA-binding protein n=1 Tax=Humibacillus xanthopallidus TaxID=412689 RepID=UPI00384E34E4
MPFRRAQPPPDLARVARILRGDVGAQEENEQERSGWVPALPSSRSAAPSALEELDADLRRARRPGVVTTPEPLRLGRWSVSSATVVALIALVVAVACVFAVRVLWAERSAGSAVPATEAPAQTRVVVTGADGAPVAARIPDDAATTLSPRPVGSVSASSSAPGAAEIVVHVVGQVVRPGLVRLRSGARVADAVAAAGGARPGADVAALNLARLVVDGEQLHVPKPGEVVTPPASAPGGGDGGSGGGDPGSDARGSEVVVSLNTADLAALDTLPGVGPVLAQRIIDWRAEHGRFTSVDELGEVSGIGDKLLAQLRPRVSL